MPIPSCPRTEKEHGSEDDLEHDKADPRTDVEARHLPRWKFLRGEAPLVTIQWLTSGE